MTQRTLPLTDGPHRKESQRERLLRVLAGSDLLKLAKDLPSRTFTADAERTATNLARQHDHDLPRGQQ